jgi:LPXTG-motif cell wall-anchored protein
VAVTDGPTLVEGLAYPEATGYLTVDAGTYALEIRAAGETDAALSLDATLEGGENYTAIAMDGGSAGVQVIIATEAAALPNTAMDQPTAPFSAVGLLLVALAGGLVVRRVAVAARA